MNSTSTVQSPYFASVSRSEPGCRLIRSELPSLAASLLGDFSSMTAAPTTHLPFSCFVFQPVRSLPLNGVSANANAGNTRTETTVTRRERFMCELQTCDGGGAATGRGLG